MNFSHSKKEKNNYSKKITTNAINPIIQPVEQAMNGLYGMPETDIEDKDHPKKGIQKIFSIFNVIFISHTYFNNDNK